MTTEAIKTPLRLLALDASNRVKIRSFLTHTTLLDCRCCYSCNLNQSARFLLMESGRGPCNNVSKRSIMHKTNEMALLLLVLKPINKLSAVI